MLTWLLSSSRSWQLSHMYQTKKIMKGWISFNTNLTKLSNSRLIHPHCCCPPRSLTLRSSPSRHQHSPPDDDNGTDSYAPVHDPDPSCMAIEFIYAPTPSAPSSAGRSLRGGWIASLCPCGLFSLKHRSTTQTLRINFRQKRSTLSQAAKWFNTVWKSRQPKLSIFLS